MQRFLSQARCGLRGTAAASPQAARAARTLHTAAAANFTAVRRATKTTTAAAPFSRRTASFTLTQRTPSVPFSGARFISSSSSSSAAAAASADAAADAASTVSPELASQVASQLVYAKPLTATADNWLFALPHAAQDLLIYLHEHLPAGWATTWVPTIVIATVIVRSAVFPLAVLQQKNIIGIAMARPEEMDVMKRQQALMAKLNAAGQVMSSQQTLAFKNERDAIRKKYGVSTLRSIIMPLTLMPLFMSMFFGLRTLGYADPSFIEGGMLWFQNLAHLDTGINDIRLRLGPMMLTVGLPLVNSVLIAASVFVNSELSSDTTSTMARFMKKMMYGFAVLSWPFCSSGIPAGVLVYWIVSNIFGMGQAMLLRSDLGRKLFNIPKQPKPLADMDAGFDNLKKMWEQSKQARSGQPAVKVASSAQAINPFESPLLNSQQVQKAQQALAHPMKPIKSTPNVAPQAMNAPSPQATSFYAKTGKNTPSKRNM
jgi:YidC/Oxa1 family membrane protein insertase